MTKQLSEKDKAIEIERQ